LIVARILVENGLSVKNGKILCNQIEVPAIRVARVTNVDRRTVFQTIKTIQQDRELKKIFESIKSAGPSLKEVAKYLNFGILEIIPIDAKMPGILAKSATLLSDRNISIRQAIVDDPELSPEPKLTLLTETEIPGDLVKGLLKIDGVAKVTIS
jgi:predicted regulator of amino acid metabolism with ACT domain